eukprot:scaffold53411_cov61-Phaeocystis_antarctica.AAC.1
MSVAPAMPPSNTGAGREKQGTKRRPSTVCLRRRRPRRPSRGCRRARVPQRPRAPGCAVSCPGGAAAPAPGSAYARPPAKRSARGRGSGMGSCRRAAPAVSAHPSSRLWAPLLPWTGRAGWTWQRRPGSRRPSAAAAAQPPP